MIKAWAFYRRSTDKQELSIEDQRRECSAFATAQGWQIVQEFTPAKGYASGLTIDRDPEFQRMLRLAEVGDHGAAFLLVYDVSRFGRLNPEEKIYWEQRFKKDGGLKVVYVKDGFRNDDSLGDGLARYVKHSEAHQYSVTLSQSTLRGSKSHAQLGHSAGGRAPYGYDRLLIDANRNPVGVLAKGHHKADKLQRVVWTPSKERAPVIREIFARADQGEGLHAIVSWLNGQKLASPAGKYWTKSQVHYLLRNRAYIGERLYNRRSYKSYRRGERSRMQNTPDQWIVTPGAHEAIVDKQVFDRVQANFQKRAFGQGRSYTFAHVLSGLIVCAKCGNKFNGYTKEGNRGHRYRYYSCAGYNRGGASICRSVHILAEEMETSAMKLVREFTRSRKFREDLRENLERLLDMEYGPNSGSRITSFQNQLSAIEKQISNLVDALKAGGVSPTLMAELARMEEQKAAVEKLLAEMKQKASAVTSLDAVVRQILDTADDFDELLQNDATNDEKKELFKAFIFQISVDHGPDEVRAEYYLRKVPEAFINRHARDTVSSIPGIPKLSLMSVAGVGFEPTTSRL